MGKKFEYITSVFIFGKVIVHHLYFFINFSQFDNEFNRKFVINVFRQALDWFLLGFRGKNSPFWKTYFILLEFFEKKSNLPVIF